MGKGAPPRWSGQLHNPYHQLCSHSLHLGSKDAGEVVRVHKAQVRPCIIKQVDESLVIEAVTTVPAAD